MRKNVLLPSRFLGFLFIALSLCYCSKPEMSDAPVVASKANVLGLIKIQFDAEVLKFQQVEDPTKATEMQLIGAAPKATRSKIDIDVYNDGSMPHLVSSAYPQPIGLKNF